MIYSDLRLLQFADRSLCNCRLRHELAIIEKQIYDLETRYLEETREIGNIFTGWDQVTSAEKVKNRKTVPTEDRLFSLSSSTSPVPKRHSASS